MTPTEQKILIDVIASAVHGWTDDGRHTYTPEDLPTLIWNMRRKLRADAQALADVRTLDVWAGDWGWLCPHVSDFSTGKRVGYIVQHGNSSERKLPGRETIGPTPEAARAKAAAWVREQKL